MTEVKAAFDREMPVEFKNIPPPSLDEIRMVLETGLRKNYEEAAVEEIPAANALKCDFSPAETP